MMKFLWLKGIETMIMMLMEMVQIFLKTWRICGPLMWQTRFVYRISPGLLDPYSVGRQKKSWIFLGGYFQWTCLCRSQRKQTNMPLNHSRKVIWSFRKYIYYFLLDICIINAFRLMKMSPNHVLTSKMSNTWAAKMFVENWRRSWLDSIVQTGRDLW